MSDETKEKTEYPASIDSTLQMLKATLTPERYAIMEAFIVGLNNHTMPALDTEQYKTAKTIFEAFREFTAALQAEIEEADPETQKQMQNMNISDFLSSDLFSELADKAAKRFEDGSTSLFLTSNSDLIPRVNNTPIDKLDFPLDKVNSYIWRLLEDDLQGQLAFDMSPSKSAKKADVIYTINFSEIGNELSITKRLEPFDKRVYMAIAALYKAGNTTVSLGQIYHAMGNNGTPGLNDKTAINNSITKMRRAMIFLNNKKEVDVYKNRVPFEYEDYLLPCKIIRAFVNGQITDSAVRLYDEPPVIRFARERNQITTIPRSLLDTPLNKTRQNILIEDYLIDRISHMKNTKSKLSNKILYKTIFENTEIKTAKQQGRAKNKIRQLLDFYKKQAFIKDYREGSDGITISY